jgi:hypothetical protein
MFCIYFNFVHIVIYNCRYITAKIRSRPGEFILYLDCHQCTNVFFWYVPPRLRIINDSDRDDEWWTELGKVTRSTRPFNEILLPNPFNDGKWDFIDNLIKIAGSDQNQAEDGVGWIDDDRLLPTAPQERAERSPSSHNRLPRKDPRPHGLCPPKRRHFRE